MSHAHPYRTSKSSYTMKSKSFSLIEMITVIVVILILMTLAIPSLSKIRASARIVICAKQMKQLGVLISTYANDHDGRLPYSGEVNYNTDKDPFGERIHRSMYITWTGKLLPYFNLDLKKYSRLKVYYSTGTDSYSRPSHENHQLLTNMLFNGGHGDLKMLVCPDAANTIDAWALANDLTHPRISSAYNKWSAWHQGGLPSSYLGHKTMFGVINGYDGQSPNSMRMGDLNSQNIMLAEGSNFRQEYGAGLTFYAGNGNNAYSFSGTFNMCGYYSGSNTIGGDKVLFSYLHDDTKELWITKLQDSYKKINTSFVNKFNKAYYPYAAASADYDAPEYKRGTLASSVYPEEDWSRFKGVLGTKTFPIYKYYAPDSGKQYYFGSMNMLSADLSVRKSHIGWLYENARSLATGNESSYSR
ncbi:MAG: hypothetical protein COA79_18790 [Planctomycetota bacterium]|nr:MAG: hypothetical protein COA79_18790 [Planctomycetota bacterium]